MPTSRNVNNSNTSIADLVGPWVDSELETSLILRCKEAWNKPLEQLTNKDLATFLQQRIAAMQILPIAKNRVENNVDDDTEFYEGELKEAIEAVTRWDALRKSN
jgi:hypothetical protein